MKNPILGIKSFVDILSSHLSGKQFCSFDRHFIKEKINNICFLKIFIIKIFNFVVERNIFLFLAYISQTKQQEKRISFCNACSFGRISTCVLNPKIKMSFREM